MDADKLTAKELAGLFADPIWAARFPPILTPDQAAELLGVSKQTLYSWSSCGLLDPCKARVGKHLRLARDRLVALFFNKDPYGPK